MPNLRLVYLTDHQYAGMTDHAHDHAANNTTAEIPSINQEQTRLPIADATRNASSNKPPVGEEKKMTEESDHEEDNDYLDTLLQEAIDGVNDRRSFGSHAVRHQQVQQEMVLSSDEESENDSSSSERVRVADAVQQFQHEMVTSDEERENSYSSPSAQVHVDAVQQKSGNKRKRRAPTQSFDERFNDLMALKAKYGHCEVSCTGENASLGQWCSVMRGSYKQMQNNQKPTNKLSDEQIQRLNDAGFKWALRNVRIGFDKRFNDLVAFKAKYGHCDVSHTGENVSLGKWCSDLRGSYKKIQNNQKPNRKLSDEQIQRLSNAGFKWYC